ncbi:alpha-1,2-fucosyltransferase [Sinomonas sp. RB5]
MRDMSVVGLLGGLGNQLFQYAYANWLAKSGRTVSFDASALRSGERRLELTELFDHKLPLVRWLDVMPYPRGRLGTIGDRVRSFVGPHRVWHEDVHGIPNRPEDAPAAWWYGYWQANRIVDQVLPDVRRSMSGFMPPVVAGRVGVHIRRGDYVGNPMLLSPNYYNSALKMLSEDASATLSDLDIVIYSDDPEWCRANMRFEGLVSYGASSSTIDDFRSLLSCEYLILSRSTFSWWAGALPDRGPRKVVAPYPFTTFQSSLEGRGWLNCSAPPG